MNIRVAVAQEVSGLVRNMIEPGRIAVYERSVEGWTVTEAFVFEPAGGIAGLRSALGLLAQRLNGCRILVSRKVEGIAYKELNRIGFHLFEADQIDDAVFDGILHDIHVSEDAEQPTVFNAPYSLLQDGHFFLDLVMLQEAYPDISSKKAFRSFLENAEFLSFTLLCAHLPPWVNEVAERRMLGIKEEHLPSGTVRVTIAPVE